ncbi:MAG TPA: glycosyltransferase family 1 protein [Galbitalea sp.]|nr:glycosyltransferase family 1 protein [Galbitalea sp.]
MKILFDCRYTRLEHHDGISRFTAGLVAALAKLTDVTMVISDKRQLALLPELPWVLATSPTAIVEPWVSHRLNRFAPDVVFTPMQTMGPFGRRFGLITTVHDLIYYENRTPPHELAWPIRLLWRLYHLSWVPERMLLARADAHATVSETTKMLMIAHGLTRHPITVVANAVDSELVTRDLAPTRDLVYMGSFMPYKNVDLLARAMVLLPGYTLHLLSKADPASVKRLSELAPAGSLQFHQGVSDEEYGEILSHAMALVSASLNEGFGLPLIEAMAGGTPIAVSDIPIFREIGGDAAVFFDAASSESFATAIRDLEKPSEWKKRSDLSRERAGHYSWDRSANALLGALTAVHETRRQR